MAAVLLGLVPPLLAGYLAARRAWPPDGPAGWRRLLAASLAAGLAVGASSATFFLWAVCAGPTAPGLAAVEVVFFGGLAALLLLAGRAPAGTPSPAGAPPWQLRLAFWVVLGCVLVSAGARLWRSPHGDWDAWVIWNLRARFLHRGADHWAEGFSPLQPWSHPDYPLLLPGSVARAWRYAGSETTAAPRLLALLFGAATAGLLTSALALLRAPSQGYLAGLALLATTGFAEWGTAQYADVPLGFYFLGSAALFEAHDRHGRAGARLPALAGLLTGLAAWTKNEGSLFLVATLLARLWVARRGPARAALREWAAFLAGLAAPAALLLFFKLRLAPANDLLAGQGWSATAGRLASPGRYALVAGHFLRALALLGPGAAGVLALYACLLGRALSGEGDPARHARAVLGLMLAGYAAVYLTTPHSLELHLATSVDRLFIQLWPLALLAFFLAVATPEESAARARGPAPG